MQYRNLRLAELIQRELGAIILREFEFPGALCTIVGVAVDGKLEEAKVKISVLPDEAAALAVYETLEGEERRLRHKLLRKLHIRSVPKLKFVIAKDGGVEKEEGEA